MNLKTVIALAIAAAFAAPVAAQTSSGSDKPTGAQRSLAEEQVQRPQAGAIMARIYDVSESVRGKELMKDILDAAYRSNGATSQKFAEELFAACMKTGGNMDTVLGKRL